MKVVAHMVKDSEALAVYFSEDGPAREMMWFIDNHCQEIFKGSLNHVPTAFALPKQGGGTVEFGVVGDIMDITGEEPILHLVLDRVTTDDDKDKDKVLS